MEKHSDLPVDRVVDQRGGFALFRRALSAKKAQNTPPHSQVSSHVT